MGRQLWTVRRQLHQGDVIGNGQRVAAMKTGPSQIITACSSGESVREN